MNYKAVVIGVSAGGTEALSQLLPLLSEDFPCPVFIVQHMSQSSDSFFIRHLGGLCMLKVKEAEDKETAQAGTIYIAPPGYHLLVNDGGIFSLSLDERVNYARPSIDVLFESAADVYGAELVGVVLTGANEDGSLGLKRIKEEGGITIVQNPATAFCSRMPQKALETTQVDFILTLDDIGKTLNSLARNYRTMSNRRI